MAEREVDHDKSSWESLLPFAGIAAFVYVERSKLAPIPKVAFAGFCAGFTYGAMEKNAPKLGGALLGVMASYAVWTALQENRLGGYVTGAERRERGRGRGHERGGRGGRGSSACSSRLYDASGRCRQIGKNIFGNPSIGDVSPAPGSNFDDHGGKTCQCWANVDVFGNIQDHNTCYPSKESAASLSNGFPGKPLDVQGGDYFSSVPCPAGGAKTTPASAPSTSSDSPPTATGLSWADLEQATPDLHAARRAAQIAWHGATSMPGISQMGYHLERALDPMTKEDVP